MQNVISAYDIFPDKLLDLLGCDSGQRFGFYPLSEIINRYYQEFYLALVGREGAEDIHSPFSEGPWG